MLNIEN